MNRLSWDTTAPRRPTGKRASVNPRTESAVEAEADIIRMVTKGEGAASSGGTSAMPAHKDKLDEAKIHLLAAYVYSLSQPVTK